MKPRNLRRTAFVAALIGVVAFGATAFAGSNEGVYAMGPGGMGGFGSGMMGGYGSGMMGGYGRGMMGGYGPGPGEGYEDERQQPYPDLNSREGRLFTQTCTQCHALPDPRQHTARQWPAVIARMKQHMRERNLPIPGEYAIKDIVAFLQQSTSGRR